MRIKYLIIILLSFTLHAADVEYRLTPNENKKIRQAKSLYRNGLINEAQNIYNELFIKSPYLKEVYLPLKEILRKNNDWVELEKISKIYLKNSNNSIQSKIDVLDAFIWVDNNDWMRLSDDIINRKSSRDRHIKLTLNILLINKKYDFVNPLIEQLRKNKKPDYYSYEMAMHYLINMLTEKSINEFLLHLEYNPNKYTMIKNRILSYPDITNNQIKPILLKHDSYLAKLILSDIEFKQMNLSESYSLLKNYSQDENDIINFVEDLIQIKEYEFAQLAIEELIRTSANELIIKQSIIQLAKIFEKLIILNDYKLPISNQVIRNELLDSPFIKINPDKLLLLEKAIDIYDSLRINTNDIESTYQLAEIKYKILGDLDAANSLYLTIIDDKKNYNSKFYTKAIIKTINIFISKGDLNTAYQTLKKNKNKINKTIYASKEAQILFYLNDWDLFSETTNTYLKKNEKGNMTYNDILKISNNVTLFDQERHNLNKYTKALLKSYQNKRTESLDIIKSLIDNPNIDISSKMIYELAYLELKQGNTEQALSTLEKSKTNNAFEESILLLKAEIYDYVLNNKSEAINLYLFFLDNFPDSIHYDIIRLRLRELAS